MGRKKTIWKTLTTESIFRRGFFHLLRKRCELPDGRIMPEYYVMEFGSWVHAVAVDINGDMILVEQYRHAAGDWFLELPGGAVEVNEKEDNQSSALRELKEETGYTSNQIVELGEHFPNPALQINKLYSFLVLDCQLTAKVNLDPFEDLYVVKKPVVDVYKMLESGEIKHSLMFSSLVLAKPYLMEYL